MIIYDAKDWFNAIRHFHTSYVIRVLLQRVAYVTGYGVVITLIDQYLFNLEVPMDGIFFSLLGILLSLLLVFRTNTAYDRFWEGRRQWGSLVNTSRNLAVLLDALLPDEDAQNRRYFATALSNFSLALKGHLRTGVDWTDILETDDEELEKLKRHGHVPSRMAALLMRRFQVLKQERLVGDADLITLRLYHQALLDITGACERIKKTPIPFSYSFFIKLFITLYLLLMPLVLVNTYESVIIIASALAAYALIGVQMIGDEIEEPFGLDCNDLPLNQIAHTIQRNMHDILSVDMLVASGVKPEIDYTKVN